MIKTLKVWLQYIIPQHTLSRCIGWLAEAQLGFITQGLIRLFCRCYKVNLEEAQAQDISQYRSFNHFFTRALKPNARPIIYDDKTLLSPVDGTVSQSGDIHENRIFQAKGKHFLLPQLLGGNRKMANLFNNGSFATFYLAPKDYHKVHMPITGRLTEVIHIPGTLFSVNLTTCERINHLFARNERVVCLFETEHGPMAIILVGAMIVASIETIWAGTISPPKKLMVRRWQYPHQSQLHQNLITLKQGEELGRFKLGSTVIICYPPGILEWQPNIVPNTEVKMGQKIADIIDDKQA